MITAATMIVTWVTRSLTNAISAGARSPLKYVYAASTTNAITNGRSPCRPSAKHHLHADQLQRDVWPRRQNAGEGHRECQARAGVSIANQVRRGDVAALPRQRP